MSSLLRMSERELRLAAAANRFPWQRAIVLAGSAAVLSVIGMQLRYDRGDATPLPGMDHLAGQLVLSAVLSTGMLVSAWFFRTVLVKRVQYAIVVSLLIHALLCLALQVFLVGMPLLPEAEAGERDIADRQMSLPEYGGMEAMQVAQPQWERTTEVDVAENAQHDLQRQQTEVEATEAFEDIQHEDLVASVDSPTRRETEERMDRAEEVEIDKQMRDAETEAPQQVESQSVATSQVQQPELEAREMNRSDSSLQNQQRERLEVQHRQQRQLTATSVRRAEATPNEIERTTVESTARTAAEATVSDTTAESTAVADTNEARRMNAEARAMDMTRTANSDLPSREPTDASAPRSQSTLQAGSFNPSRAAAADGSTSSTAPAAGGAASMQRSASRSADGGAGGGTSAASVNIASASGAGSPGLSASSAASGSSVSRGGASVPTGSAARGGGSPATRRSRNGVGSLSSGSLSRRQGSGAGSGAQLGQAAGGSVGGAMGRSSGTSTGAVGTRAEGVAVTGARAGGGSSGSVLAGGPSRSASGAARSGSGLPAGGGRGGTFQPSGSRGSGTRLATRSGTGTSGLTGRTGPSARLSGDTTGGAPASGRGGRRSAAALPAGALAAEQGGALVIAGPQADGGGSASGGSSRSGGGLSGPRMASTPRRSAGLPGASRGGGNGSVGRRRPGLPGGAGGSRASRRRSSGGRPRLASEGEIAGLIKRSVPGISPIETEQISPGFSMRRPEMRREVVQKLGGNDASEAAVERGLAWLVRHQLEDGRWRVDAIGCRDHDCGDHGRFRADEGATGLALMAFLGAGHTHQRGDYQDVVAKGLEYLVTTQKDNGDLFENGSEYTWLYSHGMAAIALCEAYGMTKDEQLREPAQLSLDFIVASQHPRFGGWRYKPRFETDTSVSGWQLMALKSGEMAGLSVSESAYKAIGMWLDRVEAENAPGTFAYHTSRKPSPAMTAEGLLMRQYLGAKRSDADLRAGADYLQMRLPRNEARDSYYWYYATQVMFHMQGDHWATWNENLRDMLTAAQIKDGPARGSWTTLEPSKDKWGSSGGRHYLTCLHILMLEVYYRHLPLYIDVELGG